MNLLKNKNFKTILVLTFLFMFLTLISFLSENNYAKESKIQIIAGIPL